MHLSILAQERAVLFEDDGGVVIQAGGTAFEQGADDDHAVLFGQCAKAFGAGAGDRLGEVEFVHRLVLAEVRAVVQFLQQDQLGTLGGRFRHARFDHGQIGGGVTVVALLDQGDGKGVA